MLIRVHEVSEQPVIIKANDTIEAASLILAERQGAIIADTQNVPIGILTTPLLVRSLLSGTSIQNMVATIMKQQFYIVAPEDDLKEINWEQGIWPVMSEQILQGMVTIEGLLKYLQNHLQDNYSKDRLTQELLIAQEQNREWESIFEACAEGIYIADNKGVGLRVNKAIARTTGVKPEELIGKLIGETVEQKIISCSGTLLVLKSQKTETITQQYQGGKRCLATSTPVFNESGKIHRVVTTIRDVSELYNLHEKLIESNKMSRQYYQELVTLRQQQSEIGNLVVSSKAMKNVIEIASQVAMYNSTVLLLGESGVGKDEIARFLHTNSQRRGKAFIKLNCGAIPHNLMETELFGYENGAFTGARKEGKPGIFELADGGSLFLDEIAELPLELQVKLLQVIQDMLICRIGGTKPLKIDVRIIAATNRNLLAMVKQGKFREDLYYRLNIIPIEIPPLRERPEDILPLIKFSVEQINKKYHKDIQLSAEVMQSLLNYHWPGNIRELKNMVERLIATKNEGIVKLEDLPTLFNTKKNELLSKITKNKLKEAIIELEKVLLINAIQEYGNLPKVARILGIDHSTAFRKVKKYKLEEYFNNKHCKSEIL